MHERAALEQALSASSGGIPLATLQSNSLLVGIHMLKWCKAVSHPFLCIRIHRRM